MKKNLVRLQVRTAVQVLFEKHNHESEVHINNITLKFICTNINTKVSDPYYYGIEVYREGKRIGSFYVSPDYLMTTWELISTPWIYDYVNDIIDLVMDNIIEEQ